MILFCKMLLFWFFVLVCCAVKCDYVSNNYYIIELPEPDIARDYNTPFTVYWNVPSKQCVSRKVIFDNLQKFGIVQNPNDTFEGGRVTIMYDPGVFPAIFKDDSENYRYRNGGVPQQGNLEMHLTAFRESLNKSIPDPDFNGVGIIDFESWRPVFRQQFGTLTPYIDLSMNIERRRHWWWPTSWQKMEATKRFEDAARVFMQTTLSIAKQMRPRAIWGYYAYPYCFNMASNNLVENCTDEIKGENDKIYWLWAESTALFPSVYSSVNLSTSQLGALVRGRLTEANRVKKPGTLVLPYFWFRYRDAGFMSKQDLTAVFEALKKTKASGLIIWGSSSDVNQADKCNDLYNYVETTLGPIVKTYTQQINGIYDVNVKTSDDYNDNSISSTESTTTEQSAQSSYEKESTFDESLEYNDVSATKTTSLEDSFANVLSDSESNGELVATKNINYLNNDTSTTENYVITSVNDQFNSVNTNGDNSLEYTSTEASTESSENFIINYDNIKDNSAT